MAPTRPASRDVEVLRALVERIDQRDPAAFNNLGVLYHSKGMAADAVDAFLRALALDPRMRTAARNLEVAATVEGACDARLAELEARQVADPDDRDAHRDQARLLRLIGRHADAVRHLDALVAEDPDDAPALLERGLLEQRAGDLRRAQRWLERAVNADPADPVSRLHLAEVLYHRGQNEQSLDTLDALLAIDATMADAHLLRGFVLGDMGRHEAAVEAARRAASLNPSLATVEPNLSIEGAPSFPATGAVPRAQAGSAALPRGVMGIEEQGALARYGLGLAFRQRGYFAEARREFVRALEQGEDAQLVGHAIAELDLIAGDFASAHAAYERLLHHIGDRARLWNEHGVAQHQGGAVDAAAESYRRALRCDPRYALAYNNLGVALADLGEGGAAREALQHAADLDPTLVRARLNLARWHARHRDPLTALALLRELVAFHPRNADAWHDMGLVLLDLHRPEEARQSLTNAVEHRPEHAEARYVLAQVLGTLGDQDGALRETQQALGLAPVRAESRLTVGIDLQSECPDAVGPLDLLALRATEPLAGTKVSESALDALLPESATDGESAGMASPVQVAGDELLQSLTLIATGDAFAARGLHGEALERYEQARRLSETARDRTCWRRAVVGEARSRCLLGAGASALPIVEQLLRSFAPEAPDDAEALALLAAAHASSVRTALAVAARDAKPLSDASKAETRRARGAIARLLRLEPQSAALFHFVGDAAVQLDEDALAIVLFRRALAVDPSRLTPRVAIARLLRKRNDLLASRLELVAALAAAPQLRDAVLELARLHMDAGRAGESLAILVQHLERIPTDVDALVLLAQVLAHEGRDDDARLVLARVRRHDSENASALWLEGTLMAQRGRVREARERWRLLLECAPDAPEAARARAALAADAEETSWARQPATSESSAVPAPGASPVMVDARASVEVVP